MASRVLSEQEQEAIKAEVHQKVAGSERILEMYPDEDGKPDLELFENSLRNFDRFVIAYSLRNAMPAFALAQEAVQRAAVFSEAAAIEGPGGVRMFALPMDKNSTGLALIKGEDRYAVFQIPAKGGYEILVAQWKPSLTDEIAHAACASLHPKLSHVSGSEVIQAAGQLSGYANTKSNFSLDEIVSTVLTRGHVPFGASSGSLIFTQSRPPRAFLSAQAPRDLEMWTTFADMIRPMVVAAGVPEVSMSDEKCDNGSALGDTVIEMDEGFYGPACALASQEFKEAVWTRNMRLLGPMMADLADDMAAANYVWGNKLLKYADSDRSTFAVRGAEPGVMGRWHCDTDLGCAVQAHMVVTRRDESGALLRLEAYPAYRPSDLLSSKEHAPELGTIETVRQVAGYAHTYADEQANPPRLTRRMLAERIARGEPLPEPVGGFDFTTNTLLPGTAQDALQVMSNANYGLNSDRSVLKEIAAGEMPEIEEIMTDYPEYGEKLPKLGARLMAGIRKAAGAAPAP